MDYLSFDIECCDGRHICEFGYVVFDEAFSVKESGCILMDPEHAFHLTGREKEPDLALAFSEEEYRRNPPFPHHYETIRALLTAPERTIFGFALRNDCEFLATAWDLYGLEPVRFSYYDAQRFYKLYAGLTYSPSLEKTAEGLGVEEDGLTFHCSRDDATAVMLCLKKMTERENASLAELTASLLKKGGQKKPFSSKAHSASIAKKLAEGDDGEQEDFLRFFLPRVTPERKTDGVFSGARVCVSRSLQKERFTEYLTLVAEMLQAGGTYSEDGKACDVMIGYVGKDVDPRLAEALQAKNAGGEVTILPLRAALRKLGRTESDLLLPDYAHLNETRPADEENSYRAQTATPTLADLFRRAPKP